MLQRVMSHHTIFVPHMWLSSTQKTHFWQSDSPEEVPIWALAGRLLALLFGTMNNTKAVGGRDTAQRA
jgi:hypothetical protein